MPNPGGINYEIRPTPSMGLGMFAQCDIKRGELILAERPLLVVSSIPTFAQFLQPNISDRDAFLQPCFDWLTPDNQAAYRALANSHIRMVVAHFTVSFELTASSHMEKWRRINKEISRINHRCGARLPSSFTDIQSSCRPNASHKSAFPTFSCQLRAMLEIKKDDEIFVTYCAISEPTPGTPSLFRSPRLPVHQCFLHSSLVRRFIPEHL
jgi:hypothetical protein